MAIATVSLPAGCTWIGQYSLIKEVVRRERWAESLICLLDGSACRSMIEHDSMTGLSTRIQLVLLGR